MELEQCNNDLLSSSNIAKSKRNTANTDTKDLNIKSLKISPQDLLDPTKEAWIRQKLENYFGIGEKKRKLLDELMGVIPHK